MCIESKVRANPIFFVENCRDEDLLKGFPISQTDLNKGFNGKVHKYRKQLLREIKVGSRVIVDIGNVYDPNDPF